LLDGEDAGFETDGTDDGCAEVVLEFSEGAAEEGTDEAWTLGLKEESELLNS